MIENNKKYCLDCLKELDEIVEYFIIGNFLTYSYYCTSCFGKLNHFNRRYLTKINDKYFYFISIVLTLFLFYIYFFSKSIDYMVTAIITLIVAIITHSRSRAISVVGVAFFSTFPISPFEKVIPSNTLIFTIIFIALLLFVWHPIYWMKKNKDEIL
ncbi:MAG: hypothetical protein CSB15_00285 [Clostridiales bacterium]|nr:MAG: hypothetical protein CSB15_00285 [Clostridiales bacterium]